MIGGLHHLYTKKRLRMRNLRSFDWFMYCVAFLAPFVLLPQIFQLFVYKNTGGLSLLTWVLLSGSNFLWAFYGFLHKERLIIFANLLMGILNFTVVYGILLYR